MLPLKTAAAALVRGRFGAARVLAAVLALLLWRALATTTAWRRPWAWALVLAVLYAVTDEFHQGFVAGRHESALDVGIDAAGALIAVVAVRIVHRPQHQAETGDAMDD